MKVELSYSNIKYRLKEARKTKKWILACLKKLGFKKAHIEFNFVSKSRILSINKEFLNHNYFTDIVTFSYTAGENEISAEIYICPWQVKKNAHLYQQKFPEEMRRVMIHGILHCAGYHDLTVAEIRAMREAENLYLKSY
ncbi:MAG: rRNA maturation RNase YbeY [Bacteroidales bacterium]